MNKGKCILQPHHILDALDEVQCSGGGALAEGPFLDVLRSAQVRRRASLTLAFPWRWRFFLFHFSVEFVLICLRAWASVPQEAIVVPPFVAIAVRPRPGVWEFVRVNVHELSVEQLTVSEYLCFKEALVDGQYVLLPIPCSCPLFRFLQEVAVVGLI